MQIVIEVNRKFAGKLIIGIGAIALATVAATVLLKPSDTVAQGSDDYSVPFQFMNGEVADAAEVNANFQALVDAVNELSDRLTAVEGAVGGAGVLAPYVSVNPNTMDGLAGPHIIFEGANVHIRSGSGTTNDDGSLLGLGNLVVGYNEGNSSDIRTGSHNVVVGVSHTFTSFGGLVAGANNDITNTSASVTGGSENRASGIYSTVNGGEFNEASEQHAWVGGGGSNDASGRWSSVSGGAGNDASGEHASISGGQGNDATGSTASVSGGFQNSATGTRDSISGGEGNSSTNAAGDINWMGGDLLCGVFGGVSQCLSIVPFGSP